MLDEKIFCVIYCILMNYTWWQIKDFSDNKDKKLLKNYLASGLFRCLINNQNKIMHW